MIVSYQRGEKKAFGNIDHYNWNHIFFVLNLSASVNWNYCWEELIQSVPWCSWKLIKFKTNQAKKRKKWGGSMVAGDDRSTWSSLTSVQVIAFLALNKQGSGSESWSNNDVIVLFSDGHFVVSGCICKYICAREMTACDHTWGWLLL